MWIPIILGGAATIWYLNKDKKHKESLPDDSDELLGSLSSKPSSWKEVSEIPKSLVSINKEFLKGLRIFTPEQGWGEMPKAPLEDYQDSFKTIARKMLRSKRGAFLVKVSGGLLLIDLGGSTEYAKYIGKIAIKKKK